MTFRTLILTEVQRTTVPGYTRRSKGADVLVCLFVFAMVATLRWWLPPLLALARSYHHAG